LASFSARKDRACSFLASPFKIPFKNLLIDAREEAVSDSEKSLSTNENTFPSGPSSPPETSVSTPPNEIKKDKVHRSYEVAQDEIILINNAQLPLADSPNLYKQAT